MGYFKIVSLTFSEREGKETDYKKGLTLLPLKSEAFTD
jgi:hypothetical protein